MNEDGTIPSTVRKVVRVGQTSAHPEKRARGERQIVVKHVASLPICKNWSFEQQQDFLRHSAAPFPLIDGDVRGLIAQVGAARG